MDNRFRLILTCVWPRYLQSKYLFLKSLKIQMWVHCSFHRLHVKRSGAGSQDGTHTCQCPTPLLLPIRTSITFQRAGLVTIRVSQWVCRERNWSRDWFQRGAADYTVHSTPQRKWITDGLSVFYSSTYLWTVYLFLFRKKKVGPREVFSSDFSETSQSGWLTWFKPCKWHVFQNVLFALCKWSALWWAWCRLTKPCACHV